MKNVLESLNFKKSLFDKRVKFLETIKQSLEELEEQENLGIIVSRRSELELRISLFGKKFCIEVNSSNRDDEIIFSTIENEQDRKVKREIIKERKDNEALKTIMTLLDKRTELTSYESGCGFY